MKKFSRFVSIGVLPLFLLGGGAANAVDLISPQTFNTVDWVSTSGGFQVCDGSSGYLPCVDGTGQLVFAFVETTVTRSFTITDHLRKVSFSVNGQGQFSEDPGTVYLRAFNAGNQLLEEAFVTTNFPNGSALPVNLVLQNAAALAAATRIEVAITGNDGNFWGGNYGTRFFAPQLVTNDNDIDDDGLKDGVDTDADGDGIVGTLQISTGTSHTCAVDGAGVHCWGRNDSGQATVPPLTNPVAVSAGHEHTCALDDTGVHCWGYNGQGRTTVPPLTNPVAVSAGEINTCALDSTGVHCWGGNFDGQSTVPPLTNPVAVSAGFYHTCALDDTGVHCWGMNSAGQATVPPLTNPVAVSAGLNHTCALDDTGVHCWGDNSDGQTTVPPLTNPRAVSAGGGYTCSLDDTGVHCWGYNGYGQTTVPPLTNPAAVSTSAWGSHTCAVDDTGVHCWGSGTSNGSPPEYGQSIVPPLSSGDNCPLVANANQLDTDSDGQGNACDTDDDNDGAVDTSDAFPLDATETTDTDNDGTGNNADTDDDGDGVLDDAVAPIQISAGSSYTCTLDKAGVHCWGANSWGQANVPILDNPIEVSAGGNYTCTVDDTGVQCWGYSGSPSTVPALLNPVVVDAGFYHACALDDTGVHCWGSDGSGQVTVPPLTNPVAVSGGDFHSCAVDDTGVKCWGSNDDGQTTVSALVNPVAVSAGGFHSCALDDSGVHCWGNNGHTQSTVPPLVNPVAVSAGRYHTCALDDSGVHCWGRNAEGQATVPALVNPVSVSAGGDHTCAVDDTGVHCWGANSSGQSTVPVLIPFVDNCPLVANIDQLDTDGDLLGDACDADDDNDTVLDVNDALPLDATESVDTDGDNLGDNTDPIIDDASTLKNYLGSIKADKVGTSVAFAGDFNGDGYGDYVIGIPGYDIPAASPVKMIKDAGRAVVISGKNGAELAHVDGTAAKDAMGFAVAGNGDIDNDGNDDVVIGAPKAGGLHTGSVAVLFGPDGTHVQFSGASPKALMGSALALGDINNDAHADIIIGSPKEDDQTNNLIDAGSVTVLSGDGYLPLLTVYGKTAKAYAGTAVASGEVDAVAGADIIVGAPNDDDLRDLAHKIVDAGSVTAYNLPGDELLKQYGAVAKAYLGKSIASGDVNNDGYADVLAGAPGDDDSEDALKDTGSVAIFSGFDGLLLAKHYDTTAKAGLGNSVAAGDINGDGFADIIAGSSKDDMPSIPKIIKDTGSVSIWSGADNAVISTLYGDVTKDYFGAAVSAGDVNSDGKADLIIGIPGFDIPPVPPAKIIKDAGVVKVISGASL